MKLLLRKISSFLFFKLIVLSGFLSYRLRNILNRNIPLALYFHNPGKELFEDVITWFRKKGFRFISLQEFLNAVQNNKPVKGAIWVSFDDGYEENISNVLPTINKYNIPATFFISTKPVEEGFFWWDLARNCPGKSSKNVSHLWKIPNRERVKQISEMQEEITSLPKRSITLESLKKLSSNPLITIGNHTDDHVICINCRSEELSREIKICEDKLIDWVGDKYVNVFSYPNGDYDKGVQRIIRDSNMCAAFTNEPKLISKIDDMYLIPRLGVVDNLSFSENILHAVGIWQPIIRRLKKIPGSL